MRPPRLLAPRRRLPSPPNEPCENGEPDGLPLAEAGGRRPDCVGHSPSDVCSAYRPGVDDRGASRGLVSVGGLWLVGVWCQVLVGALSREGGLLRRREQEPV